MVASGTAFTDLVFPCTMPWADPGFASHLIQSDDDQNAKSSISV